MPYESLIPGLKFEIRLADLTARDVVIVTCPVSREIKVREATHHPKRGPDTYDEHHRYRNEHSFSHVFGPVL